MILYGYWRKEYKVLPILNLKLIFIFWVNVIFGRLCWWILWSIIIFFRNIHKCFFKLKRNNKIPYTLKYLRKYLLFQVEINFFKPWWYFIGITALKNKTVILRFWKSHKIVLNINNKTLFSCHNYLLFLEIVLKLYFCPVWKWHCLKLV